MNLFHRWYCHSRFWASKLYDSYLPMLLEGQDLGADVLEIGPGPGLVTNWLRRRVRRLTAIEIDHRLAALLRRRAAGTNVAVVEGDATAMPFPAGRFSAAVCLTMLHHVPSAALQDRLLAETCRVLRPGGRLIGMDSTPSLRWNLYHLFDDRVPVDPATFDQRLAAAGFADIAIGARPGGFTFRARKPAP